jgi:hypothetical protein
MRIAALIIGLIWAGFWTWFGLASGISEGLDVIGIIIHAIMPGLFFFTTIAVAWKRGVVGGILLIFLGLVVAIGYPLMVVGKFPATTIVAVLITMALPPLMSGALFWKASWKQ